MHYPCLLKRAKNQALVMYNFLHGEETTKEAGCGRRSRRRTPTTQRGSVFISECNSSKGRAPAWRNEALPARLPRRWIIECERQEERDIHNIEGHPFHASSRARTDSRATCEKALHHPSSSELLGDRRDGSRNQYD